MCLTLSSLPHDSSPSLSIMIIISEIISVKSKSVSRIFKYFDASTFFELSLSHPKIRKKRQYVVYFQSIGVFILRYAGGGGDNILTAFQFQFYSIGVFI
jgi:hypothetical protein